MLTRASSILCESQTASSLRNRGSITSTSSPKPSQRRMFQTSKVCQNEEPKKPNYGEQVTDSINKAMKGNIPESEVDQKMDEAYTNARLAAIRDFASSSKSSSQSSQPSQSSKNPTIVVNRVSRR